MGRVAAPQFVIAGTRNADRLGINHGLGLHESTNGGNHAVGAGQRQLIKPTVAVHYPGTCCSCRQRVGHGVHALRIGYPHQHVSHRRGVGHWPQQVKDRRHAKFATNWPNMAKRRMKRRGKHEAETRLSYGTRYLIGGLLDARTEGFEHVGGSTFAGRRPVAVLTHRHAGTCDYQRRHSRHIDRSTLVATRAHDVDCPTRDFSWKINRCGGFSYGLQEAGQFISCGGSVVICNEQMANLIW